MKIYGFNNNGVRGCSSDTRFMSDKELLGKLHIELKSAKTHLVKLEEEMQMLADLSKAHRYSVVENVGRCFMEMDSVNSDILELNSKIKRLKDEKR